MLKKIIIFLGVVFLLSVIVIQGMIIYNTAQDPNPNFDYVLALGSGLDGEDPKPALVKRLEKSLEVLKENPGKQIIVSGGQGEGETITEAEAMKRFLIANGIMESRIIKEEKSTSTSENIKYSREIVLSFDPRPEITVLVVTSDFHMYRAKYIANKYGFIAYGAPAPTPQTEAARYWVREYFACIKTFVFD